MVNESNAGHMALWLMVEHIRDLTLHIDAAGNIGIGHDYTLAKLDVNGNLLLKEQTVILVSNSGKHRCNFHLWFPRLQWHHAI